MTTARTIVTRALGEIMFLAEGETPSAGGMADGIDALNGLFASWHNQGMLVLYPPGSTWKGSWSDGTGYAVGDGVARSGATYTCSVAHTSTPETKPGSSPNWATYWTLYAETPLTAASTFPLGPEHERGVVSMLAVDLAPSYGVTPSPITLKKASAGETYLMATFMPMSPAGVDGALLSMPSQVWPDSGTSVT